MTEEECRAANTTSCQTPGVLRQAAYEHRHSQQLHHHVVTELDIAPECWEASIPGPHNNSGSIRSMFLSSKNSKFKHISIRAAVSLEQYYIWMPQLLLFCAFIAKKRTLYYCLLLAEENLPILDILSSCHETAWLLVTLQHVIKDISYALMQACINAFDNWMQIAAY